MIFLGTCVAIRSSMMSKILRRLVPQGSKFLKKVFFAPCELNPFREIFLDRALKQYIYSVARLRAAIADKKDA